MANNESLAYSSASVSAPPLVHRLVRSITYCPSLSKMAAVFLNDASVEVFTPPRLPHEAPRSSYVLRHHTAYRANIVTALSPLHDESALVTASTAHAQHGPHYLSVWAVKEAPPTASSVEMPKVTSRITLDRGNAPTTLLHGIRSGLLFSASDRGGEVCAWNLSRGECVAMVRLHEMGVSVLSELRLERADADVLVSASRDGECVLWDTNEAVQVAQRRRERAKQKALAAAPSSSSSSSSSSSFSVSSSSYTTNNSHKRINNKDKKDRVPDDSPEHGIIARLSCHEGGVHSLVAAQRERLLFSAGVYNPKASSSSDVAVWSFRGAEESWPRLLRKGHGGRRCLRGHSGQVVSLAVVAGDGASSTLVSADAFGALRVWDISRSGAEFGRCLQEYTLQQHPAASLLATTPPPPTVPSSVAAPLRFPGSGFPAGCTLLAAMPVSGDVGEYVGSVALLSSVGATFEVLRLHPSPVPVTTTTTTTTTIPTTTASHDGGSVLPVVVARRDGEGVRRGPGGLSGTEERIIAEEEDDASLLVRLLHEQERPKFSRHGTPLSLRRRRTALVLKKPMPKQRGVQQDEGGRRPQEGGSGEGEREQPDLLEEPPQEQLPETKKLRPANWGRMVAQVSLVEDALATAAAKKSRARDLRPPAPEELSEDAWRKLFHRDEDNESSNQKEGKSGRARLARLRALDAGRHRSSREASTLLPRRAATAAFASSSRSVGGGPGAASARALRRRAATASLSAVTATASMSSFYRWNESEGFYGHDVASSSKLFEEVWRRRAAGERAKLVNLRAAVNLGVQEGAEGPSNNENDDDEEEEEEKRTNEIDENYDGGAAARGPSLQFLRPPRPRPVRRVDFEMAKMNQLRHLGL